jgi:hypothetical protein
MADHTGKIEKGTELVLDATAEVAKSILEPASPVAALLKDAGLSLVPGLGTAVASFAVKVYTKRLERRLDEWLGLVAMYLEMGAVSAAATEISDHIDEEWAQQGVVEGVRAILNDIDDAALPSLARLTAHHLKAHTVHDTRDKQAARLLCACDRATFMSLLQITTICNRDFPPEHDQIEIVIVSRNEPSPAGLRFQIRRPGVEDSAAAQVVDYPAVQTYFRAFHLLKQHEFARDNPSGFFGVIAGPQLAVISREQVKYLSIFIAE